MNKQSILTAFHDFVIGLRASGRAPSTISVYSRTIHLLTSLTEDLEIRQVSEKILFDFILRLENGYPHKTNRSKSTMNQVRSCIRTFFLWAFSSGIISKNPAINLRLARNEKRPIRAISEREVGLLFEAIRSNPSYIARRDEALFGFYTFSGLRRNEVLSLKIDDLDFSRNRIWVSETKTGTGKFKTIPDKLKNIIIQYLYFRPHRRAISSSPFLFPGRDVIHPLSCRSANLRFEYWKKLTDIREDLTLHSFRSGFATRLYDVTKDPILVSNAMGHRNLASIHRYISMREESIRAAMEKAFQGI